MDYSDQDWNTFAKSLKLLPDAAVTQTLAVAEQGEAAFQTWESVWANAAAAMGVPREFAAFDSRSTREIAAAFFKAEAVRRGLTSR